MKESNEGVVDLRGILSIFRKRLIMIIMSVIIVGCFGAVYTFFIASPVYTASTQLVAKLPASDSSSVYAGQVTGNIQMVNTINQVIVSPAILDKVKNNLNLNTSLLEHVTATNATNSQVINITVKYNNPYTAQKIADETAKVFSNNAQNILNITNVSVLAGATVNTTPVSPRPLLYIGISVIIGLVLGLGLALIREAFNNKIVTEQDVEVIGLTLLGTTAFAKAKDFNSSKIAQVENTRAQNPSRTRRGR